MTLEAPHRRKDPGPRVLEKAAVTAYGIAVWLVAHVPQGLARWVIGTASQAGYVFWPTKRAWSKRPCRPEENAATHAGRLAANEVLPG